MFGQECPIGLPASLLFLLISRVYKFISALGLQQTMMIGQTDQDLHITTVSQIPKNAGCHLIIGKVSFDRVAVDRKCGRYSCAG